MAPTPPRSNSFDLTDTIDLTKIRNADLESLKSEVVKRSDKHVQEAKFAAGAINLADRRLPPNEKQAITWYRKAADRGLVEAQVDLGVILAKSASRRNDFIEAHKWFNLASYKGNQTAKKHLRLIEKLMKPGEIRDAHEIARNWMCRRELMAFQN